MAASVVCPRLSSLSEFLRSLRCLRQVSTKLYKEECASISVVQKRTIHLTEKTNKNDKFNLSSSNRRKRKFRYNEKQKDVVTGKLQTFQLDSLPGDTANCTSGIRQDALASTLHQAMTSLLEGSEIDPKLSDCNIEITKVKIAHDYGHVTFYWISMDGDNDKKKIEELLQSNQNAIRLLLPSYHRLHISPRVVFARDKQAQYMADVDLLLLKSRQQLSEE